MAEHADLDGLAGYIGCGDWELGLLACRELCRRAGLLGEWDAMGEDGGEVETFAARLQALVDRAAEKLGVEI